MLGTVFLWDRSPAAALSPGTFVPHKVKATCPGLCLSVAPEVAWKPGTLSITSVGAVPARATLSKFQGPPEVEDFPHRDLNPGAGSFSLKLQCARLSQVCMTGVPWV